MASFATKASIVASPNTAATTISSIKKDTLFNYEVIIRDKSKVNEKLKAFILSGKERLAIITDFDFTLTKFSYDNKRLCSCHKVIEDCGLLPEEFHTLGKQVQAKYYPLEIDPYLSEEERIKYMIEWVHCSNNLMIKYKVTKEIIRRAVKEAFESNRFQMRTKVVDFITQLHSQQLPLLIFSAGITDVVEEALKYHLSGEVLGEVFVISNKGIFEEQEGSTKEHALIAFEEPAIHVFNKRSSAFMHAPYFQREDHKHRRNVLLIGDSLGDICMADAYETSSNHTANTDNESSEEDDSNKAHTLIAGYESNENSFKSIENVSVPLHTINTHITSSSHQPHHHASHILKIGFLNDRVEERLLAYSQAFDIVVLGDGGFEVPSNIVDLIIHNERVAQSILNSDDDDEEFDLLQSLLNK